MLLRPVCPCTLFGDCFRRGCMCLGFCVSTLFLDLTKTLIHQQQMSLLIGIGDNAVNSNESFFVCDGSRKKRVMQTRIYFH